MTRPSSADPVRRRVLATGLALAGASAVPGLSGCGRTSPKPRPGDAEWRNWSGAQRSRPSVWLNPRDEDELVASIREGRTPLRVTGAGHSFSALCNTDDRLYSLDQLQGIVHHDPHTLQATVWAGTRLHALGEPLWAIGQGLINQGDVDVQSVGGACGTSTHGTGARLGSFSSMLRGVRLITADGDIINADDDHETEVFQAATTSLGTLGILSQCRLQNRPAYRLREREFSEDLKSVLSNLDRYAKNHRHFEFWAFFEASRAIVKLIDETEAPDSAPPAFELPVDHVLDLTSAIAHNLPGSDGAMQRLLMRLHSDVERVGRSYRIFPSPRNSRFNEMEYELPAERGPDCLLEIIATVRRAGLRTLFPIEYRLVAADDCWLSPFYGRASASISIHQHHRVDYRPLFDLVEPILQRHEGRPHWGKLHTLDARRLSVLYPRWDDFQRLRRRLDPDDRMLNAHLRKLLVPA